MNGSDAERVADRRSRRLLLLFTALVAAYCFLVLSLPVFPSQDGPMHQYFSQVLFRLLTHSSSLYARYYHVRHVLPPYALYYYLLIAISRVLPMVWADKIVVAIAVANLGFGFAPCAGRRAATADRLRSWYFRCCSTGRFSWDL